MQVSNPVGNVFSTPPAVLAVNPEAAPGTVVQWGERSGQFTVPVAAQSGVVAIAAGFFHVAALKNGMVVAWGNNDFGQTSVPAGLIGVTAIAAGGHHTVVLKDDGTVVAWGRDEFGQTSSTR